MDEHVGCGKLGLARLNLHWYKSLHQISVQTFLHICEMDARFFLCVEIASISKQTHWRWKWLVDNCLELLCLSRVCLWTCTSYLLFPYSTAAHWHTEQVEFSATVIPVTLSDYEGNFVYLNECKEIRVWSRPQWSQWDWQPSINSDHAWRTDVKVKWELVPSGIDILLSLHPVSMDSLAQFSSACMSSHFTLVYHSGFTIPYIFLIRMR